MKLDVLVHEADEGGYWIEVRSVSDEDRMNCRFRGMTALPAKRNSVTGYQK